jgi:hypothetical protein
VLVPYRAKFQEKGQQLSIIRRTKSILTEASAMEGLDDVSHWQCVFAMFISNLSESVGRHDISIPQCNVWVYIIQQSAFVT